jgi:hypothetical protein
MSDHVGVESRDDLKSRLIRFIAAYESMRRRFGDEYQGRFAECDDLVKQYDELTDSHRKTRQ